MQAASAAYKTAIDRGEQQLAARVRFDWFRGAQPAAVADVDEITVERQITSSLPQEVTLISGVTAATATVGLTGDPRDNRRTPGWLYSPYQSLSPYADAQPEGTPVTVELGLQLGAAAEPVLFTQIAGQVRDLTVDAHPDGSHATVQIVDSRERFRFTPSLPVVVGNDPVIPASGFPQKPGLDVQFVVDQIARQAGYYASPPVRAQCALSAPLHGSAWPEIGNGIRTASYWNSVSTSTALPVRFAPGKFALGMEDQAFLNGQGPNNFAQWFFASAAGSVVQTDGQSLFLEAWHYFGPTHNDELGGVYDSTGISRRVIWRTDGAGHIEVQYKRSTADPLNFGFTSIGVVTTGWHYVGLHFAWSSFVNVHVRIDGATELLVGGGGTADGDLLSGAAIYNTGTEAFQVTKEPYSATMWNDAYVPNAYLEPGLSELVAMPPLDATADSWSILQAIATATAGTCLLDEPGAFRWWNRRHWGAAGTAAGTVQRTLRAATPLKTMTVQQLADRVRNIIRAPVSPVRITSLQAVWSIGEVVAVPARGQLVRFIDLSPAQAYQVVTTYGLIPSGGATTQSGYRAARNQDGTGGVITNLTMLIEPFASAIKVTVSNPNSYQAWLVSPSGAGYPTASNGNPSAVVMGRLITTDPIPVDTATSVGSSTVIVEYRDTHSISDYGEKPLTLDDSVWRQDADDTLTLAQDIGFTTSRPCPQWSSVTILADPALMLGDLVTAYDDSGATGINDPAWVLGITTRRTADGAEQDLLLRPVGPPGVVLAGELGIPDRATLDGRWRLA